MNTPKTIGVISERNTDAFISVLGALTESCGLLIMPASKNDPNCDGFIFVKPLTSAFYEPEIESKSSIHVFLCETNDSSANIQFGVGQNTPVPFRGHKITAACALQKEGVRIKGEVIATASGKPVWISTFENGFRRDYCWVSTPWIQKHENAFRYLNGNNLMNLLPILEWLRIVSDWHVWKFPATRACFMFDDPNLHSPQFGFVRYQQLADEGKRHGYHTSFATVPLDGYYTNRTAAQIFKENPKTLSLLIHGNNHTKRELASREPPHVQLAQMQQSIARINRLEKVSGVTISKIMAPPHGICSEEMMNAMKCAGFEAVCVSNGSVHSGNSHAKWTKALGTEQALIVSSFPVIPRFGLDRHPENQVLLAKYLNQPIIPVGHHWDLASGTDLLTATAKFINDLGSVSWTDMETIARSNYRYRINGNEMHVRIFSRITNLQIPKGIESISVEVPWIDPREEAVTYKISTNENNEAPFYKLDGENKIPVILGCSVEVRIVLYSTYGITATPKTPLLAMIRRLIVEGRDRIMPHLPKKFIRS